MPFAKSMHLKLRPQTQNSDKLDISLYHPLLYDKFKEEDQYLIQFENFEEVCSKRAKDCDLYMEIITNVQGIRRSYIPCEAIFKEENNLQLQQAIGK